MSPPDIASQPTATVVRLFVGGLPENASQEDVAARFKAFGSVTSCEVMPDKPGCTGVRRAFAYLNFVPRDSGAVHKCLTVYNHSKWRGQTLRVELAKPDYPERLRKEWQEEEAHAAVAAASAAAVAASGGVDAASELPPSKLLTKAVEARKHKRTAFPPVVPLPLSRLPWSCEEGTMADGSGRAAKLPRSFLYDLNRREDAAAAARRQSVQASPSSSTETPWAPATASTATSGHGVPGQGAVAPAPTAIVAGSMSRAGHQAGPGSAGGGGEARLPGGPAAGTGASATGAEARAGVAATAGSGSLKKQQQPSQHHQKQLQKEEQQQQQQQQHGKQGASKTRAGAKPAAKTSKGQPAAKPQADRPMTKERMIQLKVLKVLKESHFKASFGMDDD